MRDSRRPSPRPAIGLPTRSCFGSTCSGSPASSGRRRARPPGRSRCWATSSLWSAATAPTSGRARTSSGWTPRLGPAGRVQLHRAGLGPSRLSLGGGRRRRVRVAAAPRPPEHRPVRRLPHRSSRRLLPHLLPAARRRRGRVHAVGPDRPDRPRRARPLRTPRHGRRTRRRGSRRRPGLHPRVPRASGRRRLQGVPLGARVGGCRPAIQGSAALSSRFCCDVRDA